MQLNATGRGGYNGKIQLNATTRTGELQDRMSLPEDTIIHQHYDGCHERAPRGGKITAYEFKDAPRIPENNGAFVSGVPQTLVTDEREEGEVNSDNDCSSCYFVMEEKDFWRAQVFVGIATIRSIHKEIEERYVGQQEEAIKVLEDLKRQKIGDTTSSNP